MAEPDWVARALGAIGTTGALATAIFTGWWYIREDRRQTEAQLPIVELFDGIEIGPYTQRALVIRNTMATSLRLEAVEVVAPKGFSIFHAEPSGDYSRSQDPIDYWSFRSSEDGVLPMAKIINPFTHQPLEGQGNDAEFIAFKLDELGDRELTVDLVLSWQHPRHQSRRFRRKIWTKSTRLINVTTGPA